VRNAWILKGNDLFQKSRQSVHVDLARELEGLDNVNLSLMGQRTNKIEGLHEHASSQASLKASVSSVYPVSLQALFDQNTVAAFLTGLLNE
jgi:hypothetical protein